MTSSTVRKDDGALRAHNAKSDVAERVGTELGLTAQVVPFSSVVGSSVMFTNASGAVVIQLAVMVPSPQFDYREHAEPFVKQLVALWNGGRNV